MIDRYFAGTVSRVGGITLEDIARNADALHSAAFDPLGRDTDLTLDSLGNIKRGAAVKSTATIRQTIHMLQKSTRMGDYGMFKEYTAMVDAERSGNLRSLLEFRYPEQGVRWRKWRAWTASCGVSRRVPCSYGSISQEAHETLALAMNMLHGKSNTGEGGESEDRLDSAGNGTRPLLGHQTGGQRPVLA